MTTAVSAVLAVDDNPTIRKAISMRLGARGFDVMTAADGTAALEMVEARPFDLVILDLQMPGMRGEEVLRRLRARYTAMQLPVIILAASGDKHDINRALDLGANDYIVKPGDLPILITRIRTQLALKDTVARLREHSALMRDVFSTETAATAEPAPRPIYVADTDTLLADVDSSYGVPFDVLLDNTPMTCFTLTADLTVMHTNRFGAQFLGYRAEDLMGRPILDVYAPDDRVATQEHLVNALDNPGAVHRWDVRQVKKPGELVWTRNTARAVRHGQSTMVLVTCEDVDDTYKLNELLTFQARHDDLTKLPNRKALEQRLTRVIESAHSEETEHALAIIDLDQFKLINDTCGHDAGDEFLRRIGRLLKTVLRKRDTIARIGGDEFAVLIEDCTVASARSAADALRSAVESFAFEWNGRSYRLSASIGIVPINTASDSAGSVLSMADTACYAAKESGRNQIHVYHTDNAPVAQHHGEMRWATSISEALAKNRFDLTFQTITPLNGGNRERLHYEILLRMRDETGAVIMPGEFLPAAERYNLADKIDRWVISRVFEWMRQRPSEVAAMEMCCINLSGQSIGNVGILRFLLEQFQYGEVIPQKICFEITETAAVADLMQATRFINQLKDFGCQFALDDFGTGFSSLAYLKQLPVDYLKIDGAFVRDMATDSIDFAMVRSINDIGHVMGKQTIAEFVEDDQTLELLRDVGVDYAQGYTIARPTPIDQFLSPH